MVHVFLNLSFRASFSDALSRLVDETVAKVRRHISEMHRNRELALAAELRDTRLGVEEMNEKLESIHASQDTMASRMETRLEEIAAESRNGALFNQKVGLWAVRLLHSMIQSPAVADVPADSEQIMRKSFELLEDAPQTDNREVALTYMQKFKNDIIGNTGLVLLADQQPRFAEPEAIERLSQWLGSTAISSTLWVTGQPEMHSTSNALKSIAFSALTAALGAKAPFISHFFELPETDQMSNGATAEELGLLGLLYNLIMQLLDFEGVYGDGDLSLERLEQLDGSINSCKAALRLLDDILNHTKPIPYCILDNLAELDYGPGRHVYLELLDVLLRRQSDGMPIFNLLLTTHGHSETLSAEIPTESTVFLKYNSRRVKQAGQLLELQIPSHTIGPDTP